MRDPKMKDSFESDDRFGSLCDLALFEADGTCRVIASHTSKNRLQPGTDFFSEIGASGSEVQFALHTLIEKRGLLVLIRSDMGPVLISDYFYLSVRLFCAVIPHVRAESVARVSHNCFPEIILSPMLSAQDMEPMPGDESTYLLLQRIRHCITDGFRRSDLTEACPANEVIRNAHRTAKILSELVGVNFHMTYPEVDQHLRLKYDPVIGALYFLVYFCYASRVAPDSDLQLSILPVDGSFRMEISKEVKNAGDVPELYGLRDLERYSRQMMDVVCVGQRVTLRLFLSLSEDLNLFGLKCSMPFDSVWEPVLMFELSVASGTST